MEKQILELLRQFLETKGITAEHSHTSSGDEILQLPRELGLMLLVEINDQNDGTHETVPLGTLAHRLTDWHTDKDSEN